VKGTTMAQAPTITVDVKNTEAFKQLLDASVGFFEWYKSMYAIDVPYPPEHPHNKLLKVLESLVQFESK
jgi:hypothetical protein